MATTAAGPSAGRALASHHHHRALAATRSLCTTSHCRPSLPRSPMMRPAANVDGPSTSSPAQERGKTFTVKLKKPVGIVFAQKAGGPVFVEELVAGGPAALANVCVGDVLLRCSAMLLKDGSEGKYEKEGYGERLFSNWERVDFDCRGQTFAHVMSALKSNSSRMGILDVSMTFRREPQP